MNDIPWDTIITVLLFLAASGFSAFAKKKQQPGESNGESDEPFPDALPPVPERLPPREMQPALPPIIQRQTIPQPALPPVTRPRLLPVDEGETDRHEAVQPANYYLREVLGNYQRAQDLQAQVAERMSGWEKKPVIGKPAIKEKPIQRTGERNAEIFALIRGQNSLKTLIIASTILGPPKSQSEMA